MKMDAKSLTNLMLLWPVFKIDFPVFPFLYLKCFFTGIALKDIYIKSGANLPKKEHFHSLPMITFLAAKIIFTSNHLAPKYDRYTLMFNSSLM